MSLNMRVRLDHSGTIRAERKALRVADATTREIAQYIVEDIRSSWSAQSPSNVGSPPAVDTGNLDSSVKLERTGRDERGRFANAANTAVHFVRIDTTQGSNPGGRGQYAAALEDPDYFNRPYMRPAVERAAEHFGIAYAVNWDSAGGGNNG
jgi:hypothetical protein